MNQTPETKQKDGVLEVTLREDPNIKVAQINVFKSEDNYWIYLRNNGNPLKRTYMNPERMAASLKIAYFIKKGMKVSTTYTRDQESKITS